MEDYQSPEYNREAEEKRKQRQGIFYSVLLFILTFITTTFAGVDWVGRSSAVIELSELSKGLPYSIAILFVLGVHEFGHYFAAIHHKVKTSLPYFIPFLSFEGIFLSFGTMGAVIRTRSVIYTRTALFDIGVYGPIAGFVACLAVYIYGFITLPGPEYLLAIHPDFLSPEYGKNALSLVFGDNLITIMLRAVFDRPGVFIPPMSEIYHYPYLCVGWFGMFVTSMNLIPVGQLDGGHIVYGMFGLRNHKKIASVAMIALIVMGILGAVRQFLLPELTIGWAGWLVWAGILYFAIKVNHPPVPDEAPLDKNRMVLGYLSILIFILTFTPSPILII
ncbi:MAG: peptidase M50 [Ignavibacteriales bacterium]